MLIGSSGIFGIAKMLLLETTKWGQMERWKGLPLPSRVQGVIDY
jgi:hypothetical protein